MIPYFRDLEQFKTDARKWFGKIAILPMSLQELPLRQLISGIEKKEH
jgi:hypothetical protein